jgi:hypothetical protein
MICSIVVSVNMVSTIKPRTNIEIVLCAKRLLMIKAEAKGIAKVRIASIAEK